MQHLPRHLMTEVRILFEGTFMTFPLPWNATFADLAERVFALEAHGEPDRIDLLIRRPRRVATTNRGKRLRDVRPR